MIFKKSLINFAMIQTVLLASSINLALQLPVDSLVTACFAFWFVTFLLTFAPAALISFLFAAYSK